MDKEATVAAGAILEDQNKALVKKIQNLKDKKIEIEKDMHTSDQYKETIEEHIQLVLQRIAKTQQALEAKAALRAEYNQVIEEMDQMYTGIIKASTKLLEGVDMEEVKITDGTYYNSAPAPAQAQALAPAVQQGTPVKEEPAQMLMMSSPQRVPLDGHNPGADYGIAPSIATPKPVAPVQKRSATGALPVKAAAV